VVACTETMFHNLFLSSSTLIISGCKLKTGGLTSPFSSTRKLAPKFPSSKQPRTRETATFQAANHPSSLKHVELKWQKSEDDSESRRLDLSRIRQSQIAPEKNIL